MCLPHAVHTSVATGAVSPWKTLWRITVSQQIGTHVLVLVAWSFEDMRTPLAACPNHVQRRIKWYHLAHVGWGRGPDWSDRFALPHTSQARRRRNGRGGRGRGHPPSPSRSTDTS